jgi:hypothetical protein
MTTYKDHEELRHYSDGDSIAVIACEGPGCRFPGCAAAAELVLAAVKPLDRETAIGKLAEVHPELDRAGIEARYARYLSGFPASEPHTITRTGTYLTEDGVQSGTVVTRRPTEAELQAAFLAAKGRGKILDDDVLTAILTAAHDAAHPEGNEK